MNMMVDNIIFGYGKKDVLKGVGFDISKGELISVIGPNGSGKSTLVKCIDGILKPKSGKVSIHDKDTKNMSSKELAKIMAYVPQVSSEVFLQRVYDTVLMGRKPHITWGVRKKDLEIVEEIMEYMELKNLADQYLNELSGGQKQRVLIARALAQEPEILILDEPTSSLDIKHQLEVMEIAKNICRHRKSSVIMVIHDLNLAYRYSDKLLLLKDGDVYAYGTPMDVLTQENIRMVYGVEVSVLNTNMGHCFMPIRAMSSKFNEIRTEEKIFNIIGGNYEKNI